MKSFGSVPATLLALSVFGCAAEATIDEPNDTGGGGGGGADAESFDDLGVVNPSGSCPVRPAEDRVGYNVYDVPTVWVPDCDNPLSREYWRVTTVDGVTAFMLPRPDGAPQLATPCTDPNHELHDVVMRYELCSVADDSARVELVNHMSIADASSVAHYLHTQLQFVVTDRATGILPFPMPSDIFDACALHESDNSSELEEICETERRLVETKSLNERYYSEPGADDLVQRLNELYGIR